MDSGYETENTIKPVRVNKIEVECPVIETSTSAEKDSPKKKEFDYYISGLISYPNKLVGKTNIHT